MAALLRIGVTPKNQPTLKDPKEAMGLYGDLNHRFAELCSEPAKSCVQSYAKYQGCKGGNPSQECGDPPTCSAYCAITSEAFRGLKAGFCTAKVLDSAALVPDWSEVAAKMDAARAARGPIDPTTIHVTPTAPGSPVDFMGKPIDPDNPCSVESSYAKAMMSHMTAQSSPGVAGGMLGSASGSTGGGAGSGANAGRPRKIMVSAGVIADSKIGGANPVYPPMAIAAREQGTVVLQATISKEGKIERLTVISGPPFLQQAALDAVRTWQYRPFLLNGQAVEVETQVNVIFQLGAPVPAQPPGSTPP